MSPALSRIHVKFSDAVEIHKKIRNNLYLIFYLRLPTFRRLRWELKITMGKDWWGKKTGERPVAVLSNHQKHTRIGG